MKRYVATGEVYLFLIQFIFITATKSFILAHTLISYLFISIRSQIRYIDNLVSKLSIFLCIHNLEKRNFHAIS